MAENSYYPSVVVRLIVCFDHTMRINSDPEPTVNDDLPYAPPTHEPLAIQDLTTRGRGDSFINNRVPKKCSVECRGHRQAWTWHLTFDWKELPIDPRTIKQAAVEIYVGTVSAAGYASGMEGHLQRGRRTSILRINDEAGRPRDDLLLLSGPVDEWKVEYGETSLEVSISGRDIRGLFMDMPLVSPNDTPKNNVLDRIDATKPIHEVIQQLCREHGLLRDIRIEINAAEFPNGVIPSPAGDGMHDQPSTRGTSTPTAVSLVDTPTVTASGELVSIPTVVSVAQPRHRRGARGRGRNNSAGGSQRMTYWDAIVRFCFVCGCIPTFAGNVLRIRPARAIFDQQRAGFDPDIQTPFANGELRYFPGEKPVSVRQLVYGRDIDAMSFGKKYAGKAKPVVVHTIGINMNSDGRGMAKRVEAWWPPRNNNVANLRARGTRTTTSGREAHEEVEDIPIYATCDPERLLSIARQIYEERGRQEVEGTITVHYLASRGGSNTDPDLTRLRPGDAIEILLDKRNINRGAPLASTLADFTRAPFEEAVRQVMRYLPDENLARVIVATQQGRVLGMLRYFRVANVKYDWDTSTGLKIELDYQNYILTRYDLLYGSDTNVAGSIQTPRGGATANPPRGGRSTVPRDPFGLHDPTTRLDLAPVPGLPSIPSVPAAFRRSRT